MKNFFKKNKNPLSCEDWKINFVADYSQQDPDTNDRRIFEMKACENYAYRQEFDFTQNDMPRLKLEIGMQLPKAT